MCHLSFFFFFFFLDKFVWFGVLQNVFTDTVLDLIVTLHKFCFSRWIWPETAPNLNGCFRILKDSYTVGKYLHITTDNLYDFDLQWLPYKGLIT